MNYKASILWSGRLYKLLERLNLEEKFNLDALVDNNMPEVLSKLQNSALLKKVAICQTNGKASTANFLNQIIAADDKTYVSNISQNGKNTLH